MIYEYTQAAQHIQDNNTGGGNSITTYLAPGFSAGITADTVLLGGKGERESIATFGGLIYPSLSLLFDH